MISRLSIDWSVLDRNLPKHLQREVHQCPKHGKVHLIRNLRNNHLYPCQFCEDDNRDMQKRINQHYQDKKLEQLRNIANIPKLFDGKTFNDFVQDSEAKKGVWRAMLDYADHFAQYPHRSRILFGKPGAGKTHLGIAVLRKLIGDGYYCRYTTIADMMAAVKSTWGDSNPKTEEEVVEGYLRPALLMIDEVGLTDLNKSDKQILYRIMNARYADKKGMIVATNLSIPELEQNIDARLVDRLREDGGKAIPFNFHSYR